MLLAVTKCRPQGCFQTTHSKYINAAQMNTDLIVSDVKVYVLKGLDVMSFRRAEEEPSAVASNSCSPLLMCTHTQTWGINASDGGASWPNMKLWRMYTGRGRVAAMRHTCLHIQTNFIRMDCHAELPHFCGPSDLISGVFHYLKCVRGDTQWEVEQMLLLFRESQVWGGTKKEHTHIWQCFKKRLNINQVHC